MPAGSGVELATAYVSLVASTGQLAPSVTRGLAPVVPAMSQAGAAGGAAMAGGVQRGMRGVPAAAGAAGRNAGKAISGGIGLGLKGLAAIGVTLAVGDFIKDSIAEARESQKVGAITTQIIKSTGGAAKITADQVGGLATAISNKTGIDDEAIQKGSNLLLTFKNVRNEAGEGANVFDRATQAAVDLSAAGFGSIEGGSKMLGKALNDPIKGISALSRAGVTFTEQQKEQIKTMVASGDTLGAQKIILQEVESQVGGTAAASATAGEKMSTTWANMKESIGTQLLPALDSVQNTASTVMLWLTENVPKAFTAISNFLRPWIEQFKQIIAAGIGLAKTIWDHFGKDIIAAAQSAWNFVKAVIDNGLKIIRGIIQVVTSLIKGDWKGVWDGLGKIVSGAWGIIKAAVKFILDNIGRVLDAGWSLIKTGVKAAWEGLGSAISGVWSKLTSWLSAPVQRALQWIQENLIDKINGLFTFLHIPLRISPIWTAASGSRGAGSANAAERRARGGVLPGWSPGRDIHEFFSPTAGRLFLSGGEAIMRPEFTRAVGGPRGVAALNRAARSGSFAGGGVFEGIGNIVSSIWSTVTDPIGTVKRMAANVLGALGDNPVVRFLSGAMSRVVDAVIAKVSGFFSMQTGGQVPVTGTVNLNGKRVDQDTARRLARAGGFTVIQGSWSNDPRSKGTHLGSGVVDLHSANMPVDVARLRSQGLLAMFRNWPGNRHIHAVNPFVQGLSSAAQAQVRRARANSGIFGKGGVFDVDTIRVGSFDQGGWLAPNSWTLAHNGLSTPEPVGAAIGGMSADLWERLIQALYDAARGGIHDGMADRTRADKITGRLQRGTQS